MFKTRDDSGTMMVTISRRPGLVDTDEWEYEDRGEFGEFDALRKVVEGLERASKYGDEPDDEGELSGKRWPNELEDWRSSKDAWQ